MYVIYGPDIDLRWARTHGPESFRVRASIPATLFISCAPAVVGDAIQLTDSSSLLTCLIKNLLLAV